MVFDLTEELGVHQYGRPLVLLRSGEKPRLRDFNNFLFQAVPLKGELYTLPELKEEMPNIFEDSSKPLVLEVGCYLGHIVTKLAAANPWLNVLGLDIKYKRVVKSCEKIKRANLTNAKIALCDIRDLLSILPPKSVYGMFVFFPDPWIKNKHEKFRFLVEEFFSGAFSKLSDNGFIWLKTDHKDYHEAVSSFAGKYGYQKADSLPAEISGKEYTSIFETIFLEQGLPIYQQVLMKKEG